MRLELSPRPTEAEKALAQELARTKRFRDGQRAFFEELIAGKPLGSILDRLVLLVESHIPGAVCSILLLDKSGKHLLHGAAPSLPEDYCAKIHGMLIGPTAGSCGTAAFMNRTVIVSDIARDPLWADFRALALPHGLRACWSVPFHDGQGRVLGTFALYQRVERAPADEEVMEIQDIARLAALAVEHARAQEALRDSEERRAKQEEKIRQAQEEVIRLQAEMLAKLQTPLIPISDQVLVMPLVGAIDHERAQRVIERLLAGITEQRARVAIIDVTGVDDIDAQMAGGLVRAAQAAKLVGAQVMLTGLGPGVAMALTSLGADLGSVITAGTLQSGIAMASALVERRGGPMR